MISDEVEEGTREWTMVAFEGCVTFLDFITGELGSHGDH